MIIEGIFGIRDVLRPEVPKAIKSCYKAGIRVIMVTGDNMITAKYIAQECGIINDNIKDPLIIEGAEFMRRIKGVNKVIEKNNKTTTKINDIDEFKLIASNICVMARSRPEDKYALVAGLKELGNIVAVTGDGTNDAPALKIASIGFAMGIAGTDIAKEASDIILLDDNFSSIITAVLWGRNIYDSIQKFLTFQLTVNLSGVSSIIIIALIYEQEILSPVQILWINLIMDSLASLALSTDSPTLDLLDKKPKSSKDYIISRVF